MPLLFVVIVVCTILSLIYTISMGAVHTPLGKTVHIVLTHITGTHTPTAQDTIIWHIRTPRAILAFIVGAGLATVGNILQILMRNPLADPHLFGISSGGTLGAVIVIVWIGGGIYAVSIGAFIGAMCAMLLILGIAYGTRAIISSERLLLSGVAVSFILLALTNFVIFQGDNNAATSALFWMLGGMGLARWDVIWIPFLVLVCAIPYCILQARSLNAIMLGNKTALTLGVRTHRIQCGLFLICALITGVCVAVSGAIGFVGLMIPHICKYIIGVNTRFLIPTSALMGGIFLVWTDAFSRIVFAPQEIPIGIITAFFGGMLFIGIVSRRPSI